MNSQRRTPYFLVLALLVAGCFSISPVAKAADASTGSSEEVSQLLSQVKTEAKALERDSEDLASWAGAQQVSWQSHAVKLSLIREHVNEAGKLLTKLDEARGTASPWEHQAIDRIYVLLKELADNTTATINHLNNNKGHIYLSPYPDYAKAGYDLAQELAALISDYVDYGDHEAEFHRLQEKLEIAER
jgi:hypothetical protein